MSEWIDLFGDIVTLEIRNPLSPIAAQQMSDGQFAALILFILAIVGHLVLLRNGCFGYSRC